jgi:uncharacterized SAM-binding protein YcdF (DUF218 family)
MAILETVGDDGWGKGRFKGQGAPRGNGGASMIRRMLIALGLGMLTSVLLFMAGFVLFLNSLTRVDAGHMPKADAIVALTGGAERISDAVDWLKGGRGQRLLISGVAHDVTRERLAQKAPQVRDLIHCCIDLGHAAQNTVGNAKETRHWVTSHGYRSIIVVTSNYHMPRAIIELERQLPGIALVRAPVVTDKLKAMDFWTNPSLLRTIGTEYAKFVVAYVRAGLTPGRPMVESSGIAPGRRA